MTSKVTTAATCTGKGTTTYTATIAFEGEEHVSEKVVSDIEALGHNYKDGKCTVCNGIDPAYKVIITAGAGGTWTKKTESGLVCASNTAYQDFQQVQVDGQTLDKKHYEVKEDRMTITFKASYLETLSAGKHTLAVVFSTGKATTDFTIKAAPTDYDTQPPKTGGNRSTILWLVLLFMLGSGLLGIIGTTQNVNIISKKAIL